MRRPRRPRRRQETKASYYETETETEEPRKRLSSSKRRAWAQTRSMRPLRENRPELETAEGAMAEDDEFEETTELAPAESEAVRSEPSNEEVRTRSGRVRVAPCRSFVANGLPAVRLREEEEGREKRQQRRPPLRHQPMRRVWASWKRKRSKARNSKPRLMRAATRPRRMTGTFTKRRRCPRTCAPATWAKCCRRRTSIIASSGISTSRTAKRKTRPARKRQPRRARGRHAAAIAAIAAHADAVRNAAVPRAAQRKPRICPSSRTC